MDIKSNDTRVDELMQLLDNLYSSYILHNATNTTTADLPLLGITNYTYLMGNAGGFLMNQSSVKARRMIFCRTSAERENLGFPMLWVGGLHAYVHGLLKRHHIEGILTGFGEIYLVNSYCSCKNYNISCYI